jgi:hypothetical protein
MSITNNANPGGQPAVLSTIVNTLDNLTNGKEVWVAIEELHAYCVPNNIYKSMPPNAQLKFGMEINFWSDVGLLNKKEDKIKVCDEKVYKSGLWPEARKRIISTEKASDFHQMISALYSKDIFKFNKNDAVELSSELGRRGLENPLNIGNTAPFYKHGKNLGYLVEINNNYYVPDPTQIIIDALLFEGVLELGSKMGLKSFLKKMSKLNPCLDGGATRIEVMSALDIKESEYLSFSTSLALKRLDKMKFIKLDPESDSREIKKLHPKSCAGNNSEEYTYITYLGET